MNEKALSEKERLAQVRENFIAHWGIMGTQWGINRTMAQIHALLMTSLEALSTDEVMEALLISRGNAHANLKELVNWGLLRIITKKGDRKEYFEAEKGVWEMFRRICIERKRREIDPMISVLRECEEASEGMTSADGIAFREMVKELEEFVSFGGKMADRAAAMPHGKAMQMAFRLFG